MDSNGKIVYLTGSHHWNNFQDNEILEKFDYTAYLNFLEKCNHNFMRLWVWEGSASVMGEQLNFMYDPLPYLRIGSEMALDGKSKFDLHNFNPAYLGVYG